MFSGASTFVEGVDTTFGVIMGITLFLLIGITLTIILFMYRYNKRRHPKAVQIKGYPTLELVWTIILLGLVVIIYYYGWTGWVSMRETPDDYIEVTVNANLEDGFSFKYDNDKVSEKLYVPVGKPVKLYLDAEDVIHSLFIPAFRMKEDMNPGLEYGHAWFEATTEGEYDLYGAELYGGVQEAMMLSEVVVMSEEDYSSWYGPVKTTEVDPATRGRRIAERNGCQACHSFDGSMVIGPTFKGIYGQNVTVFTNNVKREIVIDDEYIRHSIYFPDDDIVEGFNKGQMISYENVISEEDVQLIIEFIKSLSE